MTSQGAALLWDVAEEHLDEAEWLFEQWLKSARSPRFNLTELQSTIERRLLARLDALAVGGTAVADKLLWPLLAPDAEAPPPRVAAAVSVLLLEPDVATRDRLLARFVDAGAPAARAGIANALRVSPRTDIDEPLRLALYTTNAPPIQAALLRVMATRRLDPGPILPTLLKASAPEVRAAAAAAAAAAPPGGLRTLVEDLLGHERPAVRAAALRTAFIWNLAPAAKRVVTEARAGLPEAILLLGLLGGTDEIAVLAELVRSAEHRKPAIEALGYTGRREAVEICLGLLDDDDDVVAKLAWEAVAAMLGPLDDAAVIAEKKPRQPRDEVAEEVDPPLDPLEQDLAKDLSPKATDEIARAEGTKVRALWAERQASFAAGVRYLAGAPLSIAAVGTALREGPLRRTGRLTLEIAIRTAGAVQLPALRLAMPAPALPTGLVYRPPIWR